MHHNEEDLTLAKALLQEATALGGWIGIGCFIFGIAFLVLRMLG